MPFGFNFRAGGVAVTNEVNFASDRRQKVLIARGQPLDLTPPDRFAPIFLEEHRSRARSLTGPAMERVTVRAVTTGDWNVGAAQQKAGNTAIMAENRLCAEMGRPCQGLEDIPAFAARIQERLHQAETALATLQGDVANRRAGIPVHAQGPAELAIVAHREQVEAKLVQAIEMARNMLQHELPVYTQRNPLSVDSVSAAHRLRVTAGTELLNRALGATQDPVRRAQIQGGLQHLALLEQGLQAGRGMDPALDTRNEATLKRSLKHQLADFESRVQDIVSAVVDEADYPNGIKEALREHHGRALNDPQRWPMVQHDMHFAMEGRQHVLSSLIVPAAQVEAQTQIGFEVPYRGRGVHCASKHEEQHAVNLAVTELSVPGAPGSLFQGLRHGVHCAWGIRDDQQRQQANINRAKEMVVAAILADPQKRADALAGRPVDVRLCSISLLTPDPLRKKGNGAERRYLDEQLAAYEAIRHEQVANNGQLDLTMNVNGQARPIQARCQILASNFGVNQGAVGKAGAVVGGWKHTEASNREMMQQMFGPNLRKPDPRQAIDPLRDGVVGHAIHNMTPRDARMAVMLRSQLLEMWEKKDYEKEGKNAYKFAARLAVLANMVGLTPAWNCKSGKDRTGMMDKEVKALVAEMQATGRVPDPYKKTNLVQQLLHRQALLKGGNHEIQQANVGLPGFKTEGVESIDRALGRSPLATWFRRGGAGAVKG